MSIPSRAILIGALLLASTLARSDGIGFSPVTQVDGISFAGKSAAVLPTCGTGVIDLSTGCTLPIALGLVP
jgi:hypothetical protein